MNRHEMCFGCGAPIRRGFLMITEKGNEVILCEKCHRLWKKHQTEEKERAEVE